MRGDFAAYINEKRKGRGKNGGDVLQKEIAAAMGVSPVYVTDILAGRRNPPDITLLEKMAEACSLTPEEREEMLDIAGWERQEAAADLPEYIMDEDIPHVRVALRRANDKKLGDDFWKKVVDSISKE